MKKQIGFRAVAGAIMTFVSSVLVMSAASASDNTIKHVDQHFSGDRVVGDVTLHFIGMNPLTQTATFDVAATIVTPQPLPSGFTNTTPATVPTPGAAPTKAPTNKFGAGAKARCDVDADVLNDEAFFVGCAQTAAQWADDINARLNSDLDAVEKKIAAFRGASDGLVARSDGITDGIELNKLRSDAAQLIAGTFTVPGTGLAPSAADINAAVGTVHVWPGGDADNARIGIARYLSLLDKTHFPDLVKASVKTRLDEGTSKVDSAAKAAYDSRRDALLVTRDRILGLSPASYVQDVPAPCTGLFGKGLERKITVKLVPIDAKTGAATVTDDVTAICPPRSFVSTGFTFAWGGSRTFGTVPQNGAVVPVAASTSAPNVIVETTHSDVRPASISFMNFRVAGSSRSEDGVYASLGVIVGTGSNSNVDFAGGASYAFARSFVLTVGGFLGSQTQLAPGYTLGGLVPASVTTPPTTTTRTIKPFVGISFNL